MRETRRSVFLPLPLLFLTAVLGFVGCGGADRPPLGYVTGTVTMEGEPVDNLILFFKPDVGRAATAITDKKGYYRLEYTKGVAGTKLGDTTVLLEWPLGYKAPFAIPARYVGTTSQLKLEVVKGTNTFDIDLEPETEAEKKKAKSTIPLE
jgi:hypothetical protein